jgi:hypothetical protein
LSNISRSVGTTVDDENLSVRHCSPDVANHLANCLFLVAGYHGHGNPALYLRQVLHSRSAGPVRTTVTRIQYLPKDGSIEMANCNSLTLPINNTDNAGVEFGARSGGPEHHAAPAS